MTTLALSSSLGLVASLTLGGLSNQGKVIQKPPPSSPLTHSSYLERRRGNPCNFYCEHSVASESPGTKCLVVVLSVMTNSNPRLHTKSLIDHR